MNKKFTGISLASFLASCAGIVISFLLLKEDVISTAHTVFEYFPLKYGVTPSTTWDGAFILGLFITVLQIVSASVAFSERFSVPWRALAGVSLCRECHVRFHHNGVTNEKIYEMKHKRREFLISMGRQEYV